MSSPWSSYAGTPGGSSPATPANGSAEPAVPKNENGSSRKATPTPSAVTPLASALEDMYGIEKSSEPRYFECLSCKRKIAGSRFAAHLDRCLGGRNSRHKERYVWAFFYFILYQSLILTLVCRKSALASSYSSSYGDSHNSYNSPSPSSLAGDSSTAPSPAKATESTSSTTSAIPATSTAITTASRKKRKLTSAVATRQASSDAGIGNGPVKTAVSKFLHRDGESTGLNGTGSGKKGKTKEGPYSAPSSPKSQSDEKIRAMVSTVIRLKDDL